MLDRIAKAEATTEPNTISGGVAAPTATIPIETNCKVAPTINPFAGSPKASPTKVLTISGCSKFSRPNNLESNMAKTPISPTINAFQNIFYTFLSK